MLGIGANSLRDFDVNNSKIYIPSNNECFGYFDIVDYSHKNLKKVDENKKIIGECLVIPITKLNNFVSLFGVNILKKYYVNDLQIVEAVSKKLPYRNQNQNFNLQFSISGDVVKIGSPALLDSF